ncbi:hypothetical protein HRS9139_02626 [Pyrenophora teres f. teres]|nr:hypothetical protein HRS9139_02626 [Pyrenophora teres f. teres]
MTHSDYHHHDAPSKKSLTFFASPLASPSHPDKPHHPNSANTPDPEANLPPTTTPTFHHHTEATTQELFFDLFFVANLTTFTSLKEINDAASLRAYTGFFALLWLTWYSNALYDVRFSSDSLFERMAKALHFGVMQRMSLLTLIILGEGIIVICKAVSKLVKIGGEFDSRVTGQIVAAVVIIYLLYMLYFDRMHDDHFGTIKQQIWASLHFFLHIMLVLVLQGVSYLIMWVVALVRMDRLDARFRTIEAASVSFSYANGTVFADTLRKNIDAYLWNTVPKGVDASKALGVWNASLVSLAQGYDGVVGDRGNMSAVGLVRQSLNTAESVAIQTMFDSLGVSVPKDEAGYAMAKLDKAAAFDKMDLLGKYEKRFELVFDYVFLSAGLALTLMACIAFLSLQQEKRHLREYLRLLVMLVTGFTICLICLVGTNKKEQKMYMESAWMLPTICILFFLCVVARHIRRPKWMKRNKAE